MFRSVHERLANLATTYGTNLQSESSRTNEVTYTTSSAQILLDFVRTDAIIEYGSTLYVGMA